jgi:hypothetical protein
VAYQTRSGNDLEAYPPTKITNPSLSSLDGEIKTEEEEKKIVDEMLRNLTKISQEGWST